MLRLRQHDRISIKSTITIRVIYEMGPSIWLRFMFRIAAVDEPNISTFF